MPQLPPVFSSPPTEEVAERLIRRLRARTDPASDAAIAELLADTVYLERLRLESDRPAPGERELLDEAARALGRGGRIERQAALERLVGAYAAEIHNRFSPTAYRIATRVLPPALVRLVTAASPARLLGGGLDPDRRLRIGGEVEALRALCARGTVLLTPTHLSNLDSPLVGYSLFRNGLPPFAYGAGLNLFTHKVMAFWMRRLGTYTVDRRKKGLLYKETLKDYSVELLRRGVNSLFFPGGTRSRSGLVEKSLKKGLLGTGLQAWQENLRDGVAQPEVFVVPMTLNTSLVLEAETLIRDSLAAEGRSRYIILDDEFSRAGTVFSFVRRVLNLDSAVHMRFGAPMDLMGNPVDPDGNSLGPNGQVIDRRRYVRDRQGQVVVDEQRDRVYTERLAAALVRAYHNNTVALNTHIAAFAAWERVRARNPGLDTWRLVRLSEDARTLPRAELTASIAALCARLKALEAQGRIHTSFHPDAVELLRKALGHFSSFHTREALRPHGDSLVVDMELTLYYRNRLVGFGLETP